jgi:hypothetical protein
MSSKTGGGDLFFDVWGSPRSGVLGFQGFDFYGFTAHQARPFRVGLAFG